VERGEYVRIAYILIIRKDEPTVTDAQIAEFHPRVASWEIVKLDGIKRLRRVFSVDYFCQALAGLHAGCLRSGRGA
jgi:hypothetical protein